MMLRKTRPVTTPERAVRPRVRLSRRQDKMEAR